MKHTTKTFETDKSIIITSKIALSKLCLETIVKLIHLNLGSTLNTDIRKGIFTTEILENTSI